MSEQIYTNSEHETFRNRLSGLGVTVIPDDKAIDNILLYKDFMELRAKTPITYEAFADRMSIDRSAICARLADGRKNINSMLCHTTLTS